MHYAWKRVSAFLFALTVALTLFAGGGAFAAESAAPPPESPAEEAAPAAFSAPAPRAAAADGKKLNVYYTNWSGQDVDDLPWDRISTINHSFWRIDGANGSYGIVSTDPASDARIFSKYATQLASHTDVDVVLSIGGWNDTKYFSAMAGTPEGRAEFIESCVNTINLYPWLGGIDIDWEYPGHARDAETDSNGSPIPELQGRDDDGVNFTALLQELRAALDSAFGSGAKIITYCASPNVPKQIDGTIDVDYADTMAYVDRVNVMTYDMAVAGTGAAMHHAALYENPGVVQEDCSVDAIVTYLLDTLHVPAAKINIGSPLYSQGWVVPSAVTSGTDEQIAAGALGQPQIRPAKNNGQFMWYDTTAMENSPEWYSGYDATAQAAYLYNIDPDSSMYQTFLSYESAASLDAKLTYVDSKGLGGLIVWETKGDSDNFAQLTRMSKGLGIYAGEIPPYSPTPYPSQPWPDANPVGFFNPALRYNPGDAAIKDGVVYKNLTQVTYPADVDGVNWEVVGSYTEGETEALIELLADNGITVPAFSRTTQWYVGGLVYFETEQAGGAGVKATGYYKALANGNISTDWAESPNGVYKTDWESGYWEALLELSNEPWPEPDKEASPVGLWQDGVKWKVGDIAIRNGKVYKKVVGESTVGGGQDPAIDSDWGPAYGHFQLLGSETDLLTILAGEGIAIPGFGWGVNYWPGAIIKYPEGDETLWVMKINDGRSGIDNKPDWGWWDEYPSVYSATVASGANGSVSGALSGEPVNFFDDVAASAAPDADYRFAGWTVSGWPGSDSYAPDPANAELKFRMPAGNVTFTAGFELDDYELTVNGDQTGGTAAFSAPAGAVRVSGGKSFVLNGRAVTVTAAPDADYTFEGWDSDGVTLDAEAAASAEITFNMPGNAVTVTPLFAPKKFNVSVSAGAGGTANASPKGLVGWGSSVAVSAVPNAGYAFTGWTASGVTLTSAASQAFVMPKNNVELTAAFEFIASSGPPPSLSTPPSSSSEPSPAPTPTPAPVEAGGEEAAAGTEGAAVTEGAAGTEVSAETEGAGEIRGETAPPDGTQNSETGSGSDGGMAGVAVPVTPSMPVAGYVPSAATGVKIVSAGVNYVVVVEGDLVYVFDESGTPLGYLRLQPGQTIEDLAEIDIAAELIPLPGARPNPKTGERAAAPFVIMFAVICSFAALTAKRGNATKRRG